MDKISADTNPAKRQGVLHSDASAIKSAMALVRANMEALPASLSAELAQVADEGAVYQLLSGQVEQALAAAAQQLRGVVSA